MIKHISVNFVLITAGFVLSVLIVAYFSSFFHCSSVEYLGVKVKEAPILKGEMGNGISSVGDSCFEVFFSIHLVEPDCEFRVTHSWRSEIVELCDFYFAGK